MTKLKLALALLVAICFFSGSVATWRSPDVQAQQPDPKANGAGVKKDEPKKPDPFVSLKDKLKMHEAEIAKIRADMLKEIAAEESKVDEAIKKAKAAKSGADQIKAQQDKFQLGKLRHDVELRFRIPSDKASTKPAPGGPLGCDLKEPNSTLAAQLNLPKGKGLIVTKVFEGRPADKAGIKAHDVLLKLAGSEVPDNPKNFYRQLEAKWPAGPVEAVILREGKQQTVTITMPPAPAAAKTAKTKKPGDEGEY